MPEGIALCSKCGMTIFVEALPIKEATLKDDVAQKSRFCPFCGTLVWRSIKGRVVSVEAGAEFHDPAAPVEA